MSAQTPIPPGSVIYVGKQDDNDPHTMLDAFLVKPPSDPSGTPVEASETWTPIASSVFGGNDGEESEANNHQFVWAMSCLAAFHHLMFQNESGIEA